MAVLLTGACGPSANIGYLQDVQPNVPIEVQQVRALTIQPGDRLRVTVFSRDRELTELFNLNDRAVNAGSNASSGHPYTVTPAGDIEMPTLGPLHVQGLTRLEVADLVRYRLLASKLLLDPTVIVEYADMAFYALGEVGHTGRIEIPTDQLTLLEAISLAGGINLTGNREKVLVFRTENGVQTPYSVDLTQTASIYESPVYYLQQGDMIYVGPNRLREQQVDWSVPSFWISTATSLATVVTLLVRFLIPSGS